MPSPETRLLLENTGNTFVTPVFNGSASLRNAAGQLVENTVKSVRRNEDLTTEKLYQDVSSLYRLDQITVKDTGDTGETAQEGFGPLPRESVMLLSMLGICWAGMAIYVLSHRKQQKKS